ncbi:MAG: NAD-dependent protein deacylase [Clostridia bacterium]|nr:NAD-dependent protein deacylase [Clostridia bacterium]
MDERLKEIIFSHKNTVFFGGAGVSTASGIPDFRSADGIYSQGGVVPPEEILSHTFFMERTAEFYKFYREKMIYPDARPNACHIALAKLEKEGRVSAVVTQNIDNLHQEAGSKTVYELHGSVYRNRCTRCGKKYGLDHILNTEGVPRCERCGGVIKPDVVLYEEQLDPDCITSACRAIANADVLIIGGTSLTVYPAASFVNYFSGQHLVLINKTPTPADKLADLVIHGDIAEAMKLD